MTSAEKANGAPAGLYKGYGVQEIGPYGSGQYGIVHDGKHITDANGNWIRLNVNGESNVSGP